MNGEKRFGALISLAENPDTNTFPAAVATADSNYHNAPGWHTAIEAPRVGESSKLAAQESQTRRRLVLEAASATTATHVTMATALLCTR
ncbi:hypothetical protein ZHAS_00015422 [Anopheles sinensis]|uniref:Uncharacterized protein n=1 Tax=Anopheles sinensis TaxID=74873 RepID=A0A084WB78_ANOSI|nr:hypothetical protein ZHAS_00015422 [Anopheles sinensis]